MINLILGEKGFASVSWICILDCFKAGNLRHGLGMHQDSGKPAELYPTLYPFSLSHNMHTHTHAHRHTGTQMHTDTQTHKCTDAHTQTHTPRHSHSLPLKIALKNFFDIFIFFG